MFKNWWPLNKCNKGGHSIPLTMTQAEVTAKREIKVTHAEEEALQQVRALLRQNEVNWKEYTEDKYCGEHHITLRIAARIKEIEDKIETEFCKLPDEGRDRLIAVAIAEVIDGVEKTCNPDLKFFTEQSLTFLTKLQQKLQTDSA